MASVEIVTFRCDVCGIETDPDRPVTRVTGFLVRDMVMKITGETDLCTLCAEPLRAIMTTGRLYRESLETYDPPPATGPDPLAPPPVHLGDVVEHYVAAPPSPITPDGIQVELDDEIGGTAPAGDDWEYPSPEGVTESPLGVADAD